MEDSVTADDRPGSRIRTLRVIPGAATAANADIARLAAELAAALRAVRGHVPDRIWWEQGPAHALLAYQALEGR